MVCEIVHRQAPGIALQPTHRITESVTGSCEGIQSPFPVAGHRLVAPAHGTVSAETASGAAAECRTASGSTPRPTRRNTTIGRCGARRVVHIGAAGPTAVSLAMLSDIISL